MRPKAAQSTSLHTIASSFLEYEQTGCSWYDKLYQNYSWADKLQLRWRIRAEMTDYIWATGCSWADSQADSLNWADSKVDKWQLSWLIAPELRYDSWADIPRPSWQIAAERITAKRQLNWQTASRAYRVQSRRHDHSSANNWQLSWQLLWQVPAELTHCSWADRLQLHWADILQLSWQTASQADRSWLSRYLNELMMWYEHSVSINSHPLTVHVCGETSPGNPKTV